MEILNRKARFDYEVIETYEAGIELYGSEVKSIRLGNANLKDSYAIVRNDEVYLLNMHISEYKEANIFNHEEKRTRKLLLHKKEIFKIRDRLNMEGYTLVPLKLYFSKNHIKILLGVCKGKKTYDKRQSLKEKDIKREIDKSLKKY